MAGSSIGTIFRITTWGESHGKGLGVVVDGCPAGLPLTEETVQAYLDRRKPGSNPYGTQRSEKDRVQILSGVFEEKTTGTPISMLVFNEDHRSDDYHGVATYYRPGHADYTFDEKFGFRDYRGGGRSSGRETLGRVAGGAVALEILKQLGITVTAYTHSIGPVSIQYARCSADHIAESPVYMPDLTASEEAEAYLKQVMSEGDSAGGTIECIINGAPAGLGEPVFEKLDARLAQAVTSVGAVKGFEIGSGFRAASMKGSEHNDCFLIDGQAIRKESNHAGGILGGISDGSEIIFRAAFKPTPSISKEQATVSQSGIPLTVSIPGRHDPIIVPRAVVVVEAMAAIVLTDLLFENMASRIDLIRHFYKK